MIMKNPQIKNSYMIPMTMSMNVILSVNDDAIPSQEHISSKNTRTTQVVGASHSSHAEAHNPHDYDTVTNLPQVGDRVDCYWPVDNAYYPSIATEIIDDVDRVIVYDDSDIEMLNLENDQLKFYSTTNPNSVAFTTLPSDK